jgi:hypothetical protein
VKRHAAPVAAAGIAAAVLSIASPAFAYIGPGAGLSAIGTLVALVSVIFLAVVGFVWYPLKRFFKGPGGPKPATQRNRMGERTGK